MKIVYAEGTVAPEEVISYLCLIGQADAVFSEVIKNREVVKKARECKIDIPDEQLQQFADNYRNLRGLHSAESMITFLENAGLSEDDFEDFCERSLLTAALRDHLADEKKVEACFVNNRSDFDCARVSTIVVKDEHLAREIIIQVREEGEDFHVLARKHSLDATTRYAGGYTGLLSRRMLPPEVSARVFNASAGDLLGPFQKDDHFQLIFIEEVLTATLNDGVKEAIKERIFREWVSPFLKGGLKVTL